jgi:uncharacterized pyridoxamine 5'-phosphate oxidase family protein
VKSTIVEYLASVPCWFLATACDGTPHAQPHVRPFSFVTLDADRIVFCTARGKDVADQLEANPLFELSAWKPGAGWLIVRGSAVYDIAVSENTRTAAYDHLTGLGETYDGPHDPRLVFFTLESGEAELADITGAVERISLED